MKPLSRFGPRLLAMSLAALLAACGGGGGASATVAGEPPPPAASTTRLLVHATSDQDLADLAAETGSTVIGHVEGTDFHVLEVPGDTDADSFRTEIEGDGRCLEVDEDSGVQFPEGGASTVPLFGDDPLASVSSQAALTKIGVPTALTRATGLGVRVAVIDTGILPTHPLMIGHFDPDGYDFVDNDPDPTDAPNGLDDNGNGKVDEGVGHGTFVASLILAVAPGVRIVPIRALNSDAVGSASSVASAIGYAVSHGVAVINLSLGLQKDLTLIRQAIANARAAGVAVIAASGNLGEGIVNFPAALTEVEAVGSVDNTDHWAPFSSWGSAVDLSAPGVDLIGAFPSPAGTARWSGTSFSTALVTGGFALLRQQRPLLSSDDILKRLETTSVSIDILNPGRGGKIGKGRLNLAAATQL